MKTLKEDPSLAELWKLQQERREDRRQFTSRRKIQSVRSPLALQQVITAFFAKDPEARKKMDENLLLLAWQRVVGETAARYSQAVRMRGHTLYVDVEDPLWMQQLMLLKEAILQKYKAEFPKIPLRDLYFFLRPRAR